MNSVTVLPRDFIRYYEEAAKKLMALVEPLSDEQLWTRPYPYGNSIGHLLLHLTGNLSYYIGTEIAGTGYVRNRPLEFSDSSRAPKDTVVKNFESAVRTVIATLEKQADGDWGRAYSAKAWRSPRTGFTPFFTALDTSRTIPGRSCTCARSWSGKNRVPELPGAAHHSPSQLRSASGLRMHKAKARPLGTGCGEELKNLLYGCDSGAETGFIPRAGVLMDHAVLDGLVDHGDGVPEDGFGLLGVARGDGLAQLAQRGAQTGCVGAVVFRAFRSLTRALQR